MHTQVYHLNTSLNFGKHAGKTIVDLLESGESRYIGYLIFNNIKRFILHPDTIKKLNLQGFFDDMPISCYCNGGMLSTNQFEGFSKSDILESLNNKYQEYIFNPQKYEESVNHEIQDYYNKQNHLEKSELNDSNADYNSESRFEKYGGYNGYSDDTIDDAFEGDPLNTWNVE
ncbi:hypothetical protein LX69_03532 [Breznakibacter xylanolyticus]|uniref:Uncharacterized protein n=1 Tax=Breznakibacter xylanolyticus TaxID=990 RepID=A0A2W7PK55_9BACT|nr:hypothetical protein [Breznakibacter xylanolyticus]PZX09659.1 hypothetical protein LX69_03532 [Breznakibacter xylanolyticus]